MTGAGGLRLRPPYHRVDRRAVGWWILRAAALVGPLLAALAVAVALWPASRPWTGPALVAGALLGPAYLLVMPLWRYRVHRWETTDQAAYATSGWVVREWRVAPISRIQTVDTTRGPLEQLLGLATLAVTTASAHGTIYIVGLDQQLARQAARHLTEVAELTPGDAT